METLSWSRSHSHLLHPLTRRAWNALLWLGNCLPRAMQLTRGSCLAVSPKTKLTVEKGKKLKVSAVAQPRQSSSTVLTVAPWGSRGGFIYTTESLSTAKFHVSCFWQLVMTVSKHRNLLLLGNRSAVTPSSTQTPVIPASLSPDLCLLPAQPSLCPRHPFRGQTGTQRTSTDIMALCEVKWRKVKWRCSAMLILKC